MSSGLPVVLDFVFLGTSIFFGQRWWANRREARDWQGTAYALADRARYFKNQRIF